VTLQLLLGYACGQYPGTDRGHSVLCTYEHEQPGLHQSRRRSGAATEAWTLLPVRAMGHESEPDTKASIVITNTVPLLVCGLFATNKSSLGAPVFIDSRRCPVRDSVCDRYSLVARMGGEDNDGSEGDDRYIYTG